MKQVRDHVRAERRFARGAVQVLGYWKLDTTPDWA
jgi:NADPH-dependent ferric siderophore reductase